MKIQFRELKSTDKFAMRKDATVYRYKKISGDKFKSENPLLSKKEFRISPLQYVWVNR